MDSTNWRGPGASSLGNSNFLKHYNAFPKHLVTSPTFSSYLGPCILRQFNEAPRTYTNAEKCVWMWTLEGQIYKSINQAIFTDNEKELEMWMPVIRGINYFLVQKKSKACTVYRASCLTPLQAEAFVEGRIVRIAMYAAGSRDHRTIFPERPVTMVFHVPDGCYNGRDISHISAHGKEEKEMLFPPYTACKVSEVVQLSKEQFEIHLMVLDNLQVERKEKSGEIWHMWEDTPVGGDLRFPCPLDHDSRDTNVIQRTGEGVMAVGGGAMAAVLGFAPGAATVPASLCAATIGGGTATVGGGVALVVASVALPVILIGAGVFLFGKLVASASSASSSTSFSTTPISAKCKVKWPACSCK